MESAYAGVMTPDLQSLLAARREKIKQGLATLEQQAGLLHAELREIETAERVILRITKPENPFDLLEEEMAKLLRPAPSSQVVTTPTMPEMILAALEEARSAGMLALEPKDIAARIAARLDPNVKGEAVSSIAWRMWKRNQLIKDGTLYSLPKTEKAADDQAGQAGSAALQPAEGGEARPGGGT